MKIDNKICNARSSMSDDKKNLPQTIQWSSRSHGQRSTPRKNLIPSFVLVLAFFHVVNAASENFSITQSIVSELLKKASVPQKEILNDLLMFCNKHGDAEFESEGNGIHNLVGGGVGTPYVAKWWIDSTDVNKPTLKGNGRRHHNVSAAEFTQSKIWTIVTDDKENKTPAVSNVERIRIKRSHLEPLAEQPHQNKPKSERSSEEKQDMKTEILDAIRRLRGAVSTQIVLNEATMVGIEKMFELKEKDSLKKLKSKFKTVKQDNKITLEMQPPKIGEVSWTSRFKKNTGKANKYLVVEWKCDRGQWEFVLSYDNSRVKVPIASAAPKLDIFGDLTMKQFQDAMKSMTPCENTQVAVNLQPQDSWTFSPYISLSGKNRFDCRRRLVQRLTIASNDF